MNEEIKAEERIFSNPVLMLAAVFIVGILGGLAGNRLSEKTVSVKESKNVVVNEQSAIIDVVKKIQPSVVSITSEQSRLDFFGNIRNSESAGTGFIVKEDGLIITNKHVVESSRASYSVFTSDGKEYRAKVVARDSAYDIAFLKISAKGLTPIEIGDSDSIKVGQRVIAIGNALGQFQNTVTTGG